MADKIYSRFRDNPHVTSITPVLQVEGKFVIWIEFEESTRIDKRAREIYEYESVTRVAYLDGTNAVILGDRLPAFFSQP